MTLAAYTGHEVLTFPDYADLETGRTLTAEPGGVYDVAPASGRLVPDIPAGWFTPVEGQERSEEEAEPGEAADPAPEPEAAEQRPEESPADQEPQQF